MTNDDYNYCHSMNCSCCSKNLYAKQDDLFQVNQSLVPSARKIIKKPKEMTLQTKLMLQRLAETQSVFLPDDCLNKISWEQIEHRPHWFQKNYLSKNVPCIITDMLEGEEICERWSDPTYLVEATAKAKVSVALTPDGFADSIHGEFLVEPYQVKGSLRTVVDWPNEGNNHVIPYIQHQNNNLMTELHDLFLELPTGPIRFIGQHLHENSTPEASNIWLGHDCSVSALHKDPYDNYYTVLSGAKHFTLLPPTSILMLHEQNYRYGRWHLSADSTFTCIPKEDQPTSTQTISCNPDLASDRDKFPLLQHLRSLHVVVQKGQTLFLPSLWYHQVSQMRGKDPYTCAVNHWFDMNFGPHFSQFELCSQFSKLNL